MPTRRSAPRSLADDLRARSDEALVALLHHRPDLAQPVPSDTTSLAARASTRASVQRALDHLDLPTWQVLEVLAALPSPVARTELARACGGPVTAQLQAARERALVWGPDRALRLVRTVSDVLGPYPAGLGPTLPDAALALSPARVAGWCEDLSLPTSGDPVTDAATVAAHLAAPGVVEGLLADAPEAARRLLERLTWDGPVGTVQDAQRSARATDATGPVDWLLARALLVPLDAERVAVPREVGRALRGGVVLREWSGRPPRVTAAPVARPERVDGAAAGAAADVVRLVHELAETWGRTPPPVLRGGGLGVRELRRAASTLDVDEATAARVVELGYVAGLWAQDAEADPVWLPTPAYDLWWAGTTATQWAALARAWWTSSRVPALVGTRDSRDGVRAALGDAVERPSVVAVRHAVVAVLAEADPGCAVRVEDLAVQLRWRRPRGPAATSPSLVDAVLADAAWLGVTALGALSGPGRALADADGDPAGVLDALLPAPVREVLLQADLTAVAPGPLAPEVAAELALAADVDSRGGATVYRFSDRSLRRALDAGRDAQEVLAFLREHSRTPVPQPLEYLVGDVARRHGRVRVGAAGAYLRSDDEAVLGEVLADRRTAVLRLRRLAPTVLAAQADPTTVLETLRAIGLAPAAEGADGTLVLARPDRHRTPPRDPPRPVGYVPSVTDRVAVAVVEGLRRGDHAERARPVDVAGDAPALPSMDPAVSLAELRAAASERRRVWVGVSDGTGRVSRRLVEPLGVSAGRITVFDHGLGEVRTLSVHRVTGVARSQDGDRAPGPRR
ncbi:helicase-associated domain-containing protein [Thalassiella azotivora]